ncbi:Histidine kinase [Candidatus Nitrotoga sp. BS]|uniref:ATP-binding protein n=1 Tax=Candidatus Nitrotoga sp. BS TaxID=2890408 RepID=UPI001EF1A16C|nr:ATP-binding protein [Candidatus Nitrotoga sp. BS]CAH1209025.1 Histidine kinase [Candidatus Nitrotoga sp. BS]
MRTANQSAKSSGLYQQLTRLWAACLLLLCKHTIVVLSIIFCSGTLLALWYLSHATNTLVQSAALQGMTLQAETLMELRNAYTSEVVDRLSSHDIEVTHDYLHKPGAIPLPATFTMDLGRRISSHSSGMVVRLYSDAPFPWRKDGGAHDDFEVQALKTLRANPQQPYYRFEDFQGRASLRYATADVMHAECVGCHNSRPDSPKHDWKVGDVRGILELIRPLDRVEAQNRADMRDTFFLFGALLTLGLGALALVITRLRRVSVELEDQVTQRTADLEQANVAMAIKEEETRSVVDHMVDCVITIDDKGIIRSANPVVENLFGYSRNEVIGQNVSILMPEPHSSAHDGYMERYYRTGQAHIIGTGREIEGLHKNGERIAVYLAVSEYFVGGKRYFTGILRDIRERVRVMKDLEQARLEAEQASQAKSAFLATMSHEIRTPMNGVIGMADVLQQTSLNSYQEEMLNLIRESAFALLDIIEDILDFSKIEAGKLEIERAPMHVAEVVEKACGMLEHLATKKEVELTLFIDPAIPEEVLGDALRLRQVIVNLTNNAIKFSSGQERPGQVSVRALMAKHDPDQSVVMVELQVTDNGIGMNKETQSRLFASFTQGDASTTRRFGGTGLGLAISRHLVELMGGEIAVHSEQGKGSTFTARLPFTLLPNSPADGGKTTDLTGLSCLVLGDDNGLRDDLSVYLKDSGAIVERVPNLTAARNRISTLPPGRWLLIIDAGHDAPPIEELRAAFRARSDLDPHFVVVAHGNQQPDIEPRFVVIRRGHRRRERVETVDIVTLDGEVMHPQSFLRAVAIAAGRAHEEESQPSDKIEAAISSPSHAMALQQGRLVLVAEDNDINQKVIQQQLALLGYAADIVGDGREALEHWKSGDYAILLTDLHMPEMDGYQLTAAIRTDEGNKAGKQRIPIVALTANALKGEAEHCRVVGMDDYLSKPVQLVDLKTTLAKWLPAAELSPNSTVMSATLATTPIIVAEPIDVSVLEGLVGKDPAVISELLLDFRSSLAKVAAELRTACQAGQATAVSAAAHKLKSSARSVGALALGELCAEMEEAGKAGDTKALEVLLPRFKAEMASVDEYLGSL